MNVKEVGLVLVGTALFGSIGYLSRDDIQKQMMISRRLKETSIAQDIRNAELEITRVGLLQRAETAKITAPIEQEAVRISNEIARFRYLNNCRVPRDVSGKGIAIREGIQIKDPTTGLTLQPGTYVCDSLGNTGIINNSGTVGDFAKLSDTPKAVLPEKTFRRYFVEVSPSELSENR